MQQCNTLKLLSRSWCNGLSSPAQMLVNASYARLYTTFTSLRTIGYVQNRHPINAINVICLICSESSLCKVVDISMNKIVVCITRAIAQLSCTNYQWCVCDIKIQLILELLWLLPQPLSGQEKIIWRARCGRFSKGLAFLLFNQLTASTEEIQEKIHKYWMLVYDSWRESYLCWFPMFDWCRSSAVQLVTVQPGTPSRWSYKEDSLRETSCHAAVHTLPLRSHSLHAWTQDDSDSRLKSSAHQVHANIHTIQQLPSVQYQQPWKMTHKQWMQYAKRKKKMTINLVHVPCCEVGHGTKPWISATSKETTVTKLDNYSQESMRSLTNLTVFNQHYYSQRHEVITK